MRGVFYANFSRYSYKVKGRVQELAISFGFCFGEEVNIEKAKY